MEIWQHYSTHCIISRASSETLTIHYDNHEVSLQTSFSETDNTETILQLIEHWDVYKVQFMKIHERLEFWFLIFEIRVYLCPLAIRPILGENALQHCEFLLTRRPQTMRWQMLLHHTIQRCWILQILHILIAFRPMTRMRGFLQPRNRHTLSGKLFFPRWPPSLRLLLLLL